MISNTSIKKGWYLILLVLIFSFLNTFPWAWATLNGVSISSATNDQIFPMQVSDLSGGAVITWQDQRNGSDFDIYAQHIDSTGNCIWTGNGVSVCTTANNQINPIVVSDGFGGVIISWQDQRNGSDYDIYAQHIDSTGNCVWTSQGIAICTVLNDQVNPSITSNGLGGAIIIWQDLRNGIDNNIFAQHIDSTGSILWVLNGISVCTSINDQLSPKVISDNSTGAIVTWQDYRNTTANPTMGADIYSQKVNSAGSTLWALNGVAICTSVDQQFFPSIESDSSGGAIIIWEDYRNGISFSIYAQRVSSTGTTQWSLNGISINNSANSLDAPALVSDGLGGVIITWYDIRNGVNSGDIFVQRVNSLGSTLWLTNGVSICHVTYSFPFTTLATTPKLVSDNVGGAIIVWGDYRNDMNSDLYAQHINSSGSVLWTTNGVGISVTADSQLYPQIVKDESGGAIITWQDDRTLSNFDIYAQSIHSDGGVPIELSSFEMETAKK